MTRSNVNYLIGLVSREAQVEEEKVTPSSLNRQQENPNSHPIQFLEY